MVYAKLLDNSVPKVSTFRFDTHMQKMCHSLTVVSMKCWSNHNDVTLMQTLHDKDSTSYENCNSISHSIISHSGMEIFGHID